MENIDINIEEEEEGLGGKKEEEQKTEKKNKTEKEKTREKVEDKEKNREIKTEEIYRITITKITDEALIKVVERVNNGFEGGRINRAQAVAWLIQRFAKGLTESVIQEIRSDHFDELTMLESLFRQAKKTGKISAELRSVLLRQNGIDGVLAKNSAKKPALPLT